MSNNNTPSPFGEHALVAVDRAAGDLRRGLPVAVCAADDTAFLVLAAEGLTDARLNAFRNLDLGTPDLVLTPERAQTLAMRLYTGAVAFLPLEDVTRWTAQRLEQLADPTCDLLNPLGGPYIARREAVPGPAEAAIKLAKLAKLLPAVLVLPLVAEAAHTIAAAQGYLTVNAQDVSAYDLADAQALEAVTHARVPMEGAEDARIFAFRPDHGGTEHFAIVVGKPKSPGPVLVRLHSECFTGDLLASLKCDCGDQLRGAIRLMGDEGEGIVLYLAQEGRGIGLINKLRAYQLQDQGFDTMEANGRLGFEDDERLFAPAAEMLKRLGFTKIKLLTNNPEKVQGLEAHGVQVVERVTHKFPPNPHNQSYLSVKKDKAGHDL
ncbi:MAG: GTP cyclohydrolase II [Alphaproteobacteria bacterium]